jgi:hypothetical protein
MAVGILQGVNHGMRLRQRPCRMTRAPPSRPFFVPFIAAAVPGLAKLLLLKKVGFWGGLQAAKAYGWPKIARKLIQFNKLHTPLEAQPRVQAGIIRAIRTPAEAYSVLQDSDVYRFVDKVASDGASHVPAWVQSLANSVASKTNVYKALKELEAEATRLGQLKHQRARAQAGEAEAEHMKARIEELEMRLNDALNELKTTRDKL